MRNRNNGMSPKPAGWWLAALFLAAAVSATASMRPPLFVGNIAPVTDQYGRPMRGSPLVAEAADRYRVEIRLAPNGLIRPPDTNGAGHYRNPLLVTNGFAGVAGMGLNAGAEDSGLFCVIFPLRLETGTQVFARVFNAPNAADATFYADTRAVAVPAAPATDLVLEFQSAQPLDPGDDDGDRLNNSWEKVLGTDPDNPDTDDDGMSDLHEMLAGTDGTDDQSKLAFQLIRRDTAPAPLGRGGTMIKPIRVKWQAVPGKTYQLEYVLDLVGEPFLELGDPVTAAEGETEIETLVDVEDADAGSFRVRLVQE